MLYYSGYSPTDQIPALMYSTSGLSKALIKSGSAADPKGQEGLASLTAEVMRRGTRGRSSQEPTSMLHRAPLPPGAQPTPPRCIGSYVSRFDVDDRVLTEDRLYGTSIRSIHTPS